MEYQLTQTGEQVQNILDQAPTTEQNLQSEITRSTEKDQELETAIGNEKTRAEGVESNLQTAIGNEKTRAEGVESNLQTAIGNEKTRAELVEGALRTDVDGINAKIPTGASSENKLATESFVNSSISTNTADFKGTFNSLEQLETEVHDANANDYAFVISTDATGNTAYNRYKYMEGTGWVFEYALNNSSFTSAQWAAINSAITAALVAKLTGLPTATELTTQLNAIIDSVATEKTRAESAEGVLRQSVNTNAAAIVTEKNRAEAAEGTLTNGLNAEILARQNADTALQQNINAEALLRDNADDVLQAEIDGIDAKIPTQASASNQLADKAFVNSSISTNTSEFKGTYNSLAELQQVTNANANDYAFVITTDSDGNKVYNRYKYVEGQGWVFEYALNNSSFTAAQWGAINSGITAALAAKINGLPDIDALNAMFASITSKIPADASSSNKLVDYAQLVADLSTKQDTLIFDNVPVENSNNPVKSGGVYNRLYELTVAIVGLQHSKQDVLTFDQYPTPGSDNPVRSGGINTWVSNMLEPVKIRISTNEADIAMLQAAYRALTESDVVVVGQSDTWPVANPQLNTIYRVADRAHTTPQNYSDYMYNGTAMVLMATYDNAIDNYPTANSNNLAKSGGIDAEIKSLVGYYTCGTAAATAAKTITANYYILLQGGSIKVKFTYKNTADDATLKIGNADAKPLYYAGRRAGSSNSWEAGEVVEIFYDGTNYYANNVAGGGAGDGVFDISVYNADNGVPHPYVDLDAALRGTNVPPSVRRGGMSVKFIQGTVQSSDNNYVQFRYLLEYENTTAGNAAFLNTSNWAFCGNDILAENPEWSLAILDPDKNIVAGIKRTGAVEWFIGIPAPVKEYIDGIIREIMSGSDTTDIDGVTKIIDFLNGLSTDTTLEAILSGIGESISSINDNIEDLDNRTPELIENPEYSQVVTDSVKNIVESIFKEGSKVIYVNTKFFGNVSFQNEVEFIGDKLVSEQNPEWKIAVIDQDKNIVFGIRYDGKIYGDIAGLDERFLECFKVIGETYNTLHSEIETLVNTILSNKRDVITRVASQAACTAPVISDVDEKMAHCIALAFNPQGTMYFVYYGDKINTSEQQNPTCDLVIRKSSLLFPSDITELGRFKANTTANGFTAGNKPFYDPNIIFTENFSKIYVYTTGYSATNEEYEMIIFPYNVNNNEWDTYIPCTLSYNNVQYNFSMSGIKDLYNTVLDTIPDMDIFTMTSKIVEYNGYYYTAVGVMGRPSCKTGFIIKSSNLYDWDVVTFMPLSYDLGDVGEACMVIKDDIAYVIMRSDLRNPACYLAKYDILNDSWSNKYPIYGSLASKPWIELYNGTMYVMYNQPGDSMDYPYGPQDRVKLAVKKLNTNNMTLSDVFTFVSEDSIQYPYLYNLHNTLYMGYTQNRRKLYRNLAILPINNFLI